MLTIWGPCECGEEPKDLTHTSDGTFNYVSFTCKKCNRSFVDAYRVEYKGRFEISGAREEKQHYLHLV